jgi:hypothetical protein
MAIRVRLLLCSFWVQFVFVVSVFCKTSYSAVLFTALPVWFYCSARAEQSGAACVAPAGSSHFYSKGNLLFLENAFI